MISKESSTNNLCAAQSVVDHCRRIAAFSDEPGAITRTFLSPAMRGCLDYFIAWAQRIGMDGVRVDAAGNFRAVLPGIGNNCLIIGSHLDTVPNAGAFDGVLGVVLGMTIAESLPHDRPLCGFEVVGFSEEEGVRFARPFLGSIGFVDGLNDELLNLRDAAGVTVTQALEAFGLDAAQVAKPQREQADAYLEFHIEQGPVLASLGLPLGIVEAIAGQTRAIVEFIGQANHAGTTPMDLRRDAFCAAAEWALAVERKAQNCAGLVATVGKVLVSPGATNIVPGQAALSLDVRHAQDRIRVNAVEELLVEANEIAARRRVGFESRIQLDQSAVPMNEALVKQVGRAVESTGAQTHRMTSGAGHDAMILAKHLPSGMIFLRSPNGVSHHPAETVLLEDIEAALNAGRYFVENFV
jgi:allantoate deiminase